MRDIVRGLRVTCRNMNFDGFRETTVSFFHVEGIMIRNLKFEQCQFKTDFKMQDSR